MVNLNSRFGKPTLQGLLSTFVLFTVIAASIDPCMAKKVNTDNIGIAINGYDTVAYFTEGRAVRGNPEFAIIYKGAEWLFSNAVHRGFFQDSPEHYIPQYGGF